MIGPLVDFVAQRARLTPERLAFEELVSGRQVSYRELDRRVGQCATVLRQMAGEDGARVAILCRNRVAFFELLFACGRAGLVAVPLNWRMPKVELNGLLADCQPQLLVYGVEDEAVATAVCGSHSLQLLALDQTGTDGYEARLEAAEQGVWPADWAPDQLWYLLYTSGTTGKPKAVKQTFGMALANMINISLGMGLRDDDVTACFLPLFHSGGINLLAVPFTIIGAATIIMPTFEPELLVQLLRQKRLSVLFGVPAVYQALALHPAFDQLDLTAVRSWACGGAALPDTLVTRYLRAGASICNGMGMTETGPTAFLTDRQNVPHKIGSVGKPQLLVQVRLVRDGRDVDPGQTGEIWFAGAGVTPGYWHAPDADAAAFSADGWLRSGDMGRCDEDGYYYIVGRLKEMFISGGENVYPAEVENVLAGHPAVLEAAVVAVPDPRWGEVGRAHLLARPGQSIPDDALLRDYCRDRLAAYKVPAQFVTVTDFPRTAAGKVQKHRLEPSGDE